MTKLFDLFSEKMNYLTQRQAVIGGNIAEANTPGYRPKEIESFDSVLQRQVANAPTGTMAVTNEKHLTGTAGGNGAFKVTRSKDVYEVKPGGNAVVVEQQLADLAQTNSDYAVVTGLYKKMMGLLKTAIGKG